MESPSRKKDKKDDKKKVYKVTFIDKVDKDKWFIWHKMDNSR